MVEMSLLREKSSGYTDPTIPVVLLTVVLFELIGEITVRSPLVPVVVVWSRAPNSIFTRRIKRKAENFVVVADHQRSQKRKVTAVSILRIHFSAPRSKENTDNDVLLRENAALNQFCGALVDFGGPCAFRCFCQTRIGRFQAIRLSYWASLGQIFSVIVCWRLDRSFLDELPNVREWTVP